MLQSSELNEILKTLISEYTTNNEFALRFLLQKNELNLTFDKILCHIRKLKLGQIKNKSNTIQKDECATIKEEKEVVDNEVQNKSNIGFSNKNDLTPNRRKWMNY